MYKDGYPAQVFETPRFRLIVSPCAGGRAFIFEDKQSGENLFTTVGGLRDAWTPALPPSSRDYIAAYTHPIATGTFNRCYTSKITRSSATLTYTAPDAPPHGASFRKTVSIEDPRTFEVSLQATFPGGANERAQQLTSFALTKDAIIYKSANAIGFYEPSRHRVVLVAWPTSDVEHFSLDRHAADALLTLTYAPSANRHTRYGFADARSPAQAQATLRTFANRPPSTR